MEYQISRVVLRIQYVKQCQKVVSMGESAWLVPSKGFYVVSNAILSCKNFKTMVNFLIMLLKINKSMGVTSFFD